MFLNVFTHQKVRERSSTILVDLFTYPTPYLSLGNYRNSYHSFYIAPFSNALDPKSEFWRYFFFNNFPFLSINKASSWQSSVHDCFRVLLRKEKNTLIWLTGMSEIYITEKFSKTQTQSQFFSSIINSRTSIYLFRSADL